MSCTRACSLYDMAFELCAWPSSWRVRTAARDSLIRALQQEQLAPLKSTVLVAMCRYLSQVALLLLCPSAFVFFVLPFPSMPNPPKPIEQVSLRVALGPFEDWRAPRAHPTCHPLLDSGAEPVRSRDSRNAGEGSSSGAHRSGLSSLLISSPPSVLASCFSLDSYCCADGDHDWHRHGSLLLSVLPAGHLFVPGSPSLGGGFQSGRPSAAAGQSGAS